MKESAKYLCHATVSRLASHRMCYVKIVLPLGTQQNSGCTKKHTLPSLLNQQNKAIIYGRFGEPNHRAFHRASLFIQNHVTIEDKKQKTKCTKARQSQTRKPRKTSGWKNLGTLPPDQGRGASLGVVGYTM